MVARRNCTKIMTIVVLVLLVAGTTHFNKTKAMNYSDDDDDKPVSSSLNVIIDITDATYGDFDADQNEDDIKIVFDIITKSSDNDFDWDDDDDDNDDASKLWGNLELKIELPSGWTFEFDLRFKTRVTDSVIHGIIYAYNTAIESGWYDAYLKGDMYWLIDDQKFNFTSWDHIVFDPPTGTGPGDPLAELILM